MITGMRAIWYASWQNGSAVIKCAPSQRADEMNFDGQYQS
jgi:hypothetical protein